MNSRPLQKLKNVCMMNVNHSARYGRIILIIWRVRYFWVFILPSKIKYKSLL